MRPLLLSMQFALCIDGSSERRRLTTLPTNMTRWNIALRLELKDSIMPWTKWLVAWSNDLATTHSAFECSKDCLPGYIIRCSNVISSPNFVLWRIFARMPGRSRRLVSVHGTLLKVPPPWTIILDPARIKPQPQGIIIFLVVHLPPQPGIIPLVQIRKGSPPLEIMEIIVTLQPLTAEQVTLLVTNAVAKDIYHPTHHAHSMVNQIP